MQCGRDATFPATTCPPACVGALEQAGLAAWLVDLLVATDVAIARGDLDSASRDLHRLIGRATQTLDQRLAALPRADAPRAEAMTRS